MYVVSLFSFNFFFLLLTLPNLQLRNAESAMMHWSMEETSFLEANPGELVHAEAVTDEDGYVTCPNFHDPPEVHKAPPQKNSNKNCNKHTRCTCAMFSKQLVGFFDVGKY